MNRPRKNVVIGFLGSQLDRGQGPARWERWRPTVSLCQQEDMQVHRFELFHVPQHKALARTLIDDIAAVSPETEVRLVEMRLANPWDFGEVYGALYDWARDYPFVTEDEQYWAHITTGTHVVQICLFLLVEARFLPGVLLQTAPPRRPGSREPGHWTLIDLDLSRYDALAQRFARDQSEARAFLKSGISTRNARFNALIEEIERVAIRSRAPILLTGPTGAGKSHLARRMYELKRSRHQVQGSFVEVNCATLQGDGAASTLFGHRKGAFTGAVADRPGLLRSADGGMLFLDEIGELGADEQAMLLKAIEEKTFYPIGSDREVSSDFQLIAGTNRDLGGEVARGRFREDLYARINLWSYTLPGLAQRPEDLEPTIDFLLARAALEQGHAVRFNVEAKRRYLGFAQSAEASWSGNFRDLSASATRLATLAEGGRITTALVEAEIARLRTLWKHTLWQRTPWQRDPGTSEVHAGTGPAVQAAGQGESAPALADEMAGDMPRDMPGDGPRGAPLAALLTSERWAALDLFERLQLEAVVRVCRQSRSLSEAGRRLFDRSRLQRSVVNDADRLRKYLLRHGLDWDAVVADA